MFVKPRAGVNVRDPVSRILIPVEGCEVPESSYWVRRIADGDVTQIPDSDKVHFVESAAADEGE